MSDNYNPKDIVIGNARLCYDEISKSWIKPHHKSTPKYKARIFDRSEAVNYCKLMAKLMVTI